MAVVVSFVIALYIIISLAVAMVPMYLDDAQLSGILDDIEMSGQVDNRTRASDLRNILESELEAEQLQLPLDQLVIKRTREGLTLEWSYQVSNPLVANISLTGAFTHNKEFLSE
jgi:hypothetical protein